MMKFVKDFHSENLMRTFLKSKDCLDELLLLEKERANFLEAANVANMKGDILLGADILEIGRRFKEASGVILSYVFYNSLWVHGSKGWPLKFEKKEELLIRIVARYWQELIENFIKNISNGNSIEGPGDLVLVQKMHKALADTDYTNFSPSFFLYLVDRLLILFYKSLWKLREQEKAHIGIEVVSQALKCIGNPLQGRQCIPQRLSLKNDLVATELTFPIAKAQQTNRNFWVMLATIDQFDLLTNITWLKSNCCHSSGIVVEEVNEVRDEMQQPYSALDSRISEWDVQDNRIIQDLLKKF
ncbi:hypothetical protein GH714_001210 [Hevea brasiliensis]|uniref:Uncharacterized protein n=1 Tax=Hevea brasiliensis TaxID=3981 RepID=A0A6A6KM47_HEVBR|nr:hypothetical protein GH714_001210 [Hevea brasiliensis]